MLKNINDLRTYYIGLISEVTVKSKVFKLIFKSEKVCLYECSIIAN